MIRYIVFDTETTGLEPFNGDKIIEIGAIELLNKERSGKTYHQLINPEKKIPKETTEITHITDDDVKNQPTFREIADDFLSFLRQQPNECSKTILVAHNISFDLKFLNHELKTIGLENLSNFEFIDTVELARERFPHQKVSLDLLCERFGISLERRKKEGHSALLDSQILVDVFLKLTEGKTTDLLQKDSNIDFNGFSKRQKVLSSRQFFASKEELKEHVKFLQDHKIKEF